MENTDVIYGFDFIGVALSHAVLNRVTLPVILVPTVESTTYFSGSKNKKTTAKAKRICLRITLLMGTMFFFDSLGKA